MNFRTLFFCLLLSAFCLSGRAAVDWSDPHSVVAAALAASPALRELDAQIDAAKAHARAAGATPNPMLMTGVQNQPIDFARDPMTMYMVGASQTLLRGDRRNALRGAANLEVQRLELSQQSRRAAIARDALVAYYEAASAESQIGANDQIAQLAASTAEAARVRYEVGTGTQSDIIRARVEANNVRHQVLMQQRMREDALARLRALVNLRPNEPIAAFSLGTAMQHHMHEDEEVALPVSTPAIAALEAEVAAADAQIQLAKLAKKPDVNIEASYGFRPFDRDMFSVVARVELPVRKKTTIDPLVDEALARRNAARAEIEMLRQQLAADFGAALASRNEAIEQIRLHTEQLVPDAKLGFESALASYQTGKSTFDALLGALQTYRALNVDYYEFQRQLLVADAEIEALRNGAPRRGGAQ